MKKGEYVVQPAGSGGSHRKGVSKGKNRTQKDDGDLAEPFPNGECVDSRKEKQGNKKRTDSSPTGERGKENNSLQHAQEGS